jgi:hypothetical protein
VPRRWSICRMPSHLPALAPCSFSNVNIIATLKVPGAQRCAASNKFCPGTYSVPLFTRSRIDRPPNRSGNDLCRSGAAASPGAGARRGKVIAIRGFPE